MTAWINRFRSNSRQLLVGTLGVCALLVLAAFLGTYSRAQSAPAQQTAPAPAQPAPTDHSKAPNQPAPLPAADAQSSPAKSQKNTDSDDDKWPEPEWATQQNQAGAPAQSTPPVTQNNAAASPAPVAQASPAPSLQQAAAPAQPEAQPATAVPAPARPDYPGMTPDEKRRAQVAQECADLLKLATDLKAQVEKTRKDELSITVVRKATEIEQMAHKVRSGTTLSTSDR